jgi:hypothetical protein
MMDMVMVMVPCERAAVEDLERTPRAASNPDLKT